jgi:hypothetical protein
LKRITGRTSLNIQIHTPPGEDQIYLLEFTFIIPPEEVVQNHKLFKRYLEGEKLSPVDFGLVKRLLQLFGGNIYIQDLDPVGSSSEIKIMINLPATDID